MSAEVLTTADKILTYMRRVARGVSCAETAIYLDLPQASIRRTLREMTIAKKIYISRWKKPLLYSRSDED